ncbi:hypothetical protein WN51_08375, partial [Melipona quadrifasciata]
DCRAILRFELLPGNQIINLDKSCVELDKQRDAIATKRNSQLEKPRLKNARATIPFGSAAEFSEIGNKSVSNIVSGD